MGNRNSGLCPHDGSTKASEPESSTEKLMVTDTTAQTVNQVERESDLEESGESHRNSLDAAILAAFENVVPYENLDPKFVHSIESLEREDFSTRRHPHNDPEDFELSELPPEDWEM